jgi:hypothetical protein
MAPIPIPKWSPRPEPEAVNARLAAIQSAVAAGKVVVLASRRT